MRILILLFIILISANASFAKQKAPTSTSVQPVFQIDEEFVQEFSDYDEKQAKILEKEQKIILKLNKKKAKLESRKIKLLKKRAKSLDACKNSELYIEQLKTFGQNQSNDNL